MEIIDYEKNAINNKQEIRKIEQFYVNGTLENLNEIVEKKKNSIIENIQEYLKNNKITIKNKNGDIIDYKINNNPILISNYFFKTLNPLANKIPEYSAEKLGVVWQLYEYLVTKVNENIGNSMPNITNFCKFAGISTNTLKIYKNNGDQDMINVIDKIEDACFDSNVSMGQHGLAKERMTIYRMKSEMEKGEKNETNVTNTSINIDLKDILERVNSYTNFSNKKIYDTKVEKNEKK